MERKGQFKISEKFAWTLLDENKNVKKTGVAVREGDNFRWEQWDKDGKMIARDSAKNMILDDGLEIIADRIGGTGTQAAIWGMAIGTSNTAVSPTQTDLQGSELDREATTNSRPSGGTERFTVTFDPGEGTGTIEEMVMIDQDAAAASRKCLTRVLTGTITKGAGDTWTGTYECTAARA